MPEVAVDVLLVDELFDASYSRLVRVGIKSSLLLAMLLEERVVDKFVLRGNLSRGVTCDALGYPARLDHGDRLAQALEEDSRRQAGDAPVEYGDVRRDIPQ